MSIINNANPGSSIVIVSTIDRYLKEQQAKQISLESLQQLLRPEALPKSDNAKPKFKDNLRFWLERGLWQLDNDTYISLPSEHESLSLEARLINIIVSQTSTDTFLEGNSVEPFVRYITCLLAQDQYSFAGGTRLTVGSEGNLLAALSQYAQFKRYPNGNEASLFLSWAQFLGFVEPDPQGYLLDPTRAILPYLNRIFSSTSSMSVQTFLNTLAQYLPMFDQGRFVQDLAKCTVETVQPRSEFQLSAALSHALLRLELMKKIRLESKSDDQNALQLYMPVGITARSVSNISLRDMT